MRTALALLLVLAGCAPSMRVLGVGPSVERLEVEAHLLALLDRVHEASANEVVACLLGRVDGGALYVTGLGATPIFEATPTSILHGGCDPARYVGAYHSHPGGLCRLSGTDVATAEKWQHTVDLVSCGQGRFGWRLRSTSGQITAAGP